MLSRRLTSRFLNRQGRAVGQDQRLKNALRQLEATERENAELRTRLVERETGGIDPGKIVWIFGSGRTGSSWLSRMMGELDGHVRWNEPLVGELFGGFYRRYRANRIGKNFILDDESKDIWLGSIKGLVLQGAAFKFPELNSDSYLIIKEPHGALGAMFMVEALPESRMVFLVRDPRDVVASALDARGKESWTSKRREAKGTGKSYRQAQADPDAFTRSRARVYLRHIESVKRAYEAHRGRKVLICYEDLRADTVNVMKHIFLELEIPISDSRIAAMVDEHAWENVPEEKKGPGKIFRKAKPGGWKEDLTLSQIQIVESITAPILEEFYSD